MTGSISREIDDLHLLLYVIIRFHINLSDNEYKNSAARLQSDLCKSY
jgi:hypothetical protein